eukprot:SAG11_NODE_12228_length_714_cov_1.551220_2_plen_38_part_01
MVDRVVCDRINLQNRFATICLSQILQTSNKMSFGEENQ